jgi:integrase
LLRARRSEFRFPTEAPGRPRFCLEAIQAQAGHASIESTRIYLHLANGWLAEEYLRVAEALDAQAGPAGAAVTG